MIIPKTEKKLVSWANDRIDDCRISQGKRESAYRQYYVWQENGRPAGGLALANMLYGHVDRLAAHLFSPNELRFSIDYENIYEKEWLEKAAIAARVVSREWERKNIDVLFGHGVKEALTYGACILKQLGGRNADGGFDFRGARLVMPWQFGLYNESVNDLADQEALLETVWLSQPEVWRRVRGLPDAEALYKRITSASAADNNAGTPTNFMHQVLSTAVLNVSLQNMTQPQPGGIVQLTNDPNYGTLGPQVAPKLYAMHELWVQDDGRDGGEDWTTIQIIEPDILIAPRLKHCNLFAPETQPYTLIQANYVPNYAWGRSELVDLLMLQQWLTEHLDDAKRLMGQQIDKLLAFPGYDGLTDELYGQFRAQGYAGLPPGSSVTDITPKMPDQLIPMIAEILGLMDRASGFPPIMSGQGDTGVRAGSHANTLMKTGSPRLRDRSLLVERQCASAADATLSMLQAKEAKAFWTNPEHVETDFTLAQLPDDRRVSVDSHSTSVIFADDHAQLIAYGLKAGVIGPEDAIEDLPFAHKERKLVRLKEREAAKAKLIHEHPELLTRGRGGGHH